MIEEKEVIQIKVYRDNKLDRIATYKPIVRDKMLSWFNTINDKFIEQGFMPKQSVE